MGGGSGRGSRSTFSGPSSQPVPGLKKSEVSIPSGFRKWWDKTGHRQSLLQLERVALNWRLDPGDWVPVSR